MGKRRKVECSVCGDLEHGCRNCPRKELVLVCGDSHSQVWERIRHHFQGISVIVNKVPGSSAQGLSNPNSRSGARNRFFRSIESTQSRNASRKWIFLMMGSVDLDFVLFHRWTKDSSFKLDEQIRLSMNGIQEFVNSMTISAETKLVIVGVHPPTLEAAEHMFRLSKDSIEFQHEYSLDTRTEWAMQFNKALQELCVCLGCIYLEVLPGLLENGIVSNRFRRMGPTDVHLESDTLVEEYCKEFQKLRFSFAETRRC